MKRTLDGSGRGRALGKRSSTFFAALGLFGAGCSLINSFDDVAPQKEQSGDAATDGASLADGATDAGADGAVSDASDAAPTRPPGAIVIGGAADNADGGEDFILTALEPSTGSELPKAREKMLVAGVFYDGARDLWYIFESGGVGPFPLPTDKFFMHVRELDTLTGEWKERSKLQLPAGLSFTTTGVLSQKIAYVAYGTPDGGAPGDGGVTTVPSPFGLVIIDLQKPDAPTASTVVPLSSSPAFVIGARRPAIPAGGLASLAASVTVAGTRYAQLTPVLVPSGDQPSLEPPILGTAPAGILIGFGSVTLNGTMLNVAITRATPTAAVSIYDPELDPSSALVTGGTFPFGDGNVKAPAFSECRQTLFVVGTNADLQLYAVSLAKAAPPDDAGALPALSYTTAATGHSGQGVYFEPYTNTVIVPFSQGNNFALTAFTLTGTSEKPQLVLRQAPRWSPPPDLRPSFVATRSPLPFPCPTQGDQ